MFFSIYFSASGLIEFLIFSSIFFSHFKIIKLGSLELTGEVTGSVGTSLGILIVSEEIFSGLSFLYEGLLEVFLDILLLKIILFKDNKINNKILKLFLILNKN